MKNDRQSAMERPRARAVLHAWLLGTWLALLSVQAMAIPSFTRQTGVTCSGCHTVFPELNTFGRQFKLRGYTLGAALQEKAFPYNLPLAAGIQVGHTSVSDRGKGADPETDFTRADKTIVQQFALYYGGKVAGKVGAMVQYNYDGIERQWGAEMADIRYADSASARGKDLLFGVSVANSPAVQDVWNTMPMWDFPHLTDAGVQPMVTSLLDMQLVNQVGGVALYGFFDSQYYGEIGFYRRAGRGFFQLLNAGHELETAVSGNAPSIRLAWEKNWSGNSVEVGVHWLRADIFPDPTMLEGPTDRFTDIALDGQYQYDSGGKHLVSLHAFVGREKREWNGSLPLGMASNPSDNLNTLRLSAHYWYQRRFGGGVALFDYRGDSDMLKYGMAAMPSALGNASGSPDTRGWTAELNWLPLRDVQNLKLGLRYTAYAKFNGAADNYNGFGRNAGDNNALFAYAWLLY